MDFIEDAASALTSQQVATEAAVDRAIISVGQGAREVWPELPTSRRTSSRAGQRLFD